MPRSYYKWCDPNPHTTGLPTFSTIISRYGAVDTLLLSFHRVDFYMHGSIKRWMSVFPSSEVSINIPKSENCSNHKYGLKMTGHFILWFHNIFFVEFFDWICNRYHWKSRDARVLDNGKKSTVRICSNLGLI